MEICIANNRDTREIIALVKEGLQEFGFKYEPQTSEADLLDIEQTYSKNGGCFLVIKEKGEVVATGALRKESDDIFKIRKMYVSKSHRNRGLGKRIFLALQQEAILRHAKHITLETSKLMTAAISLYRSNGFVIAEGKAESPRCDILMIKELQ